MSVSTRTGCMLPWEIFGWLYVLTLSVVLIFLLRQWTPSKDYIPKRKKRPPDKRPLITQWASSWTTTAGKAIRHYLSRLILGIRQTIDNYITRLPVKRRRHSSRLVLSSHGKYQCIFRSPRRKGHRPKNSKHQGFPKPSTRQQQSNRTRIIASTTIVTRASQSATSQVKQLQHNQTRSESSSAVQLPRHYELGQLPFKATQTIASQGA